jgi:hypothetical protein
VGLCLGVSGPQAQAKPASDNRHLGGESESVVQVANLVYSGIRSSHCFSDYFLIKAEKESAISTSRRFHAVKLSSEDLFHFPLVVMTGEGAFQLPDSERENLRRFIERGGFLLASAGCSSQDWDRSFRREMARIFPQQPMQALGMDPPIFHTVCEITELKARHGTPKPLIRKEYNFDALSFAGLLAERIHDPTLPGPPQFESVDIGEEKPVDCLKNGLWLLDHEGRQYAVLLSPAAARGIGETTGLQVQLGAVGGAEGTRTAEEFFDRLEQAVRDARCYRGKILSLEQAEHLYSGESAGIAVHRLPPVEREHVILPAKTLDLLDRNVIQFVRQRKRLAERGQPTKKGLLFYGPPGTGKTFTIQYLATALPGHTTLLISAEQVGLLGDYMTLARLLQPSLVVLEDVDLIARNRTHLGACEEAILNKLLNEMDGLRPDAEVLFVLTTNRPEALEAALSSRPGRIDQAIEFPLPEAAGREKLVRLYARGAALADGILERVVERTENVSAAFIKELMRRATQFQLERDGTGAMEWRDVEQALDEMLFSGGSLNLSLLGASGHLGFAASRMR